MTIPKGFWICDRVEHRIVNNDTCSTDVSTYALITDGKITRKVKHSFDDCPARVFESTHHSSKEWFKFGHRHRSNNKPAVVETETSVQQESISYSWHKHGEIHNDSGPAYLVFIKDKCGVTINAQWCSRGRLHNDNGPAVLEICSGRVVEMSYFLKGSLHRTNGPAVHLDNKTNITQKWMRHGLLHRTDGPSVVVNSVPIRFTINGRPISEFEIIMLGYELEGESWVKI